MTITLRATWNTPDHKRGWLGRRKDNGHEALIGRDCGRQKFKATAVFRSERRRLNEAQALQTNLKRVQAHLDNSAYAGEVSQVRERLHAVGSALEDIRDRLPKGMVGELERRAKDDEAAVFVSFRYDDEDSDGNPIYRWDPERIGVLSGLSIWNPDPIRHTFATLHNIRDAFGDAKADPAVGRRTLKKWADTLDQLPRCREAAAGFETKVADFCDPENLKLLCLLVPNQNYGVTVARFIVERTKSGRVNPGDASLRFYNELRKSISASANGRPFKI